MPTFCFGPFLHCGVFVWSYFMFCFSCSGVDDGDDSDDGDDNDDPDGGRGGGGGGDGDGAVFFGGAFVRFFVGVKFSHLLRYGIVKGEKSCVFTYQSVKRRREWLRIFRFFVRIFIFFARWIL